MDIDQIFDNYRPYLFKIYECRPANAHGFAVRLTVLDQISRSHGCYLKPHGFLAFLAIKNPHYLAYHFEYGRPVFIYRDSPKSK